MYPKCTPRVGVSSGDFGAATPHAKRFSSEGGDRCALCILMVVRSSSSHATCNGQAIRDVHVAMALAFRRRQARHNETQLSSPNGGEAIVHEIVEAYVHEYEGWGYT